MTTPPANNDLNKAVVQISIDQVYQEVRSLHDALQRIESTLSSMRDLEPRLRDLEKARVHERIPDFESRIRSLEERRLPHSVLAVLATVASTGALVWQAYMAK